MAIKLTPNIEKVITEGAELSGRGSLLLLITGGMGDVSFYSSAANIRFDLIVF
jgi:hypothetical protein